MSDNDFVPIGECMKNHAEYMRVVTQIGTVLTEIQTDLRDMTESNARVQTRMDLHIKRTDKIIEGNGRPSLAERLGILEGFHDNHDKRMDELRSFVSRCFGGLLVAGVLAMLAMWKIK